jgi:Cu+-exporting ATPase
MKKITLGILGMSCSACSNGLEKHLNKQQGIVNASVNLVMANATIEYDDTLLDLKTIENFIKSAGFKSSGIFDLNKPDGNKEKSYPLIIFALLTVVLMYVSMGHMVGLYLPKCISPETSPIGYALALILLAVPFLYYGKDIFIGGVKSIIYLSPDMNALVTLGVGASFIFSVVYSVLIFLGNHTLVHNLYFESVGAVIFFVKLGRKIDGTSKAKTRQAIRDLVQITPKNAVVLRDGQEVSVTIDLVEKGDTLVCRPGEKIAVDGVITNGKAHLDESFITGESKPSLKTVGNTVVAGSVNFDGYLEYSAQKIGRDSTVSEIVNMVVEASNTKLPIAKTADKICGVFVPFVMVVAVLTFIGQLIFAQGLSQAITAFVTVLVVACPCALGLATPLAIVVGEGLCAKKGILVKNGKTMEVADKTSVVIFDKTGTLTYGDLRVFKAFNYSDLTDGELL